MKMTFNATQDSLRAGARRILIWSPNFSPEIMGIPPLVTDAAEWLADRGHAVRVVTALPNYPSRIVSPEYRGRFWVHERHGSIHVDRSWLRVRPEEGLYDKLLYEASFAAASFPLVARRLRDGDTLICVVPSLLAGLVSAGYVGARASLGRSASLVYWVQDLVLDAAGALDGVGARQAAVLRRISTLQAKAFRAAARVVVCSPGFRERLVAAGVAPGRVKVVPNWVDVDRYSVAGRSARDGAVRFLYAGNLGYSQGFETLISATRLAGDGVSLRIVGAGNMATRVRALARDVPNVRVEPPVSEAEVPTMLASSDVQVVVQRAVSGDTNFPSKIGPYLSSGKPLLASIGPHTAAASFLRESKAALLVEPDDPNALAAAMRQLRDDAGLRRELGSRGRAFARAQLAAKVCLPRLEEAFLG